VVRPERSTIIRSASLYRFHSITQVGCGPQRPLSDIGKVGKRLSQVHQHNSGICWPTALRRGETACRNGLGDTGEMAKELSTKDRKKLGKKSFALPGKRKYPIPDKAHARNALARVAQNGTPAEQKKVKAAVKKRFPSIGKKKKKS
jgi:hypothetical protein